MTERNPPRWLVVPCTLAILLLGGAAPAPPVRAQAAGGGGPAMTMADIIGMTTFGGQRLGYAQPIDIDVASPDGRLHAVLVKRGDVAKNTNVFSLLLFRTDQLFTRPRPDTLLTLVSASHVTYGTDWPYFPLDQNKSLQKLGLPADDLKAIESGTAMRLLPKLKA